MIKKNKFKLVEGRFSPSDSNNVLFALFNGKINFHQLEAFRIQEQCSGNVDHHQQRITELKDSYSSIKNIISEASNKGHILEIHSSVEITLVEK